MEKVLVINPLPPYATLCHVLYHKEITAAGIEFEYWNVAKFTWGEIHSNRHGIASIQQRIFNSLEELLEALNHEDPDRTLIVVQAWNSPAFFCITSEIKKRNFVTSVFWAEPLPTCGVLKNLGKKIKNISLRNLINKIFKKIRSVTGRYCEKHGSPIVPDIVFAAGLASAVKYPWNKVVPCNYADYELWLNRRFLPVNPMYLDKCVFLDDAFCMHPDIQLLWGGKRLNSTECSAYYSAMVKVFEKIENEFSLPVIIAAHPKAQYRGDEFGNRPIIHGDTIECMRGAKLVVAHTSTSCAYAAMYGVPILFIKNSTTEIYEFMTSFIDNWSDALGAKIIDADSLPDKLEPYCSVNFELYNKYLNRHMTWPQYRHSPSAPDLINFIRTLMRNSL